MTSLNPQDTFIPMPHFYGAVGAPNVGHHEWQPHSRRSLIADDVRFGSQGARLFLYETRLFLNEIRWRRRPPEYGLRIVACVMVVLVHLFLLFLMLAVQPPGYLPPEGSPEVTTLDVRLISRPKPPPPPPPIKLPRRHVKKTVRHVPVHVKRAPVAAMPPVPRVAVAKPAIKLTPTKPAIAPPKPQSQPVQQAAASPQVPTPMPQVELSPTPPKVVLEKSKMAVPPPELSDTQMAPVNVPSPALQPVPTMHTAPTVKLGNPALATVQPGEVQGVTTLSVKVEAAMPEVPAVDTPPTTVQITATPLAQPSISAPQVTLHAVHAPTAELAPIPQTPDTTQVTPALDLPMAQVPEPQAPDVQAPSVHVEMPPATVETVNQPAPASSVHKAPAPQVAASKSWAPANDQFKPISGRHGEQGGAKRRGSKPMGTVQLMPRGNSDVMTRSSDRLGYKPTIFDQYWAPDNESILDTFLRRFIEKLTVVHTFHLAPGVRVKCALGPMAIFLACGGADGPRPKPSKSNDPRLNMAPARPLAPGLGSSTPARPSTAPTILFDNDAKCAVARVAGGPPPPGCPGAPVKPSQSDQWK